MEDKEYFICNLNFGDSKSVNQFYCLFSYGIILMKLENL